MCHRGHTFIYVLHFSNCKLLIIGPVRLPQTGIKRKNQYIYVSITKQKHPRVYYKHVIVVWTEQKTTILSNIVVSRHKLFF